MFSRLNAVLAIYFYAYVSEGVGKLIKNELSRKHLFVAVFGSLLVSYFFSWLWLFFVTLVVLLVSAKFFTARLGGLSGDIYGFIIEFTELTLLNYIIIVNFA